LTDPLAAAIPAACSGAVVQQIPPDRVAMDKRQLPTLAVTRLFLISGICPEAGQAASWSRTTLPGTTR
jgi:hypothetical protein